MPVYGPIGNRFAPSTVTFVRTLLDGTRGAYRYLGGVLNPLAEGGFKLEPHDARPPPARVGRDNKDILRGGLDRRDPRALRRAGRVRR